MGGSMLGLSIALITLLVEDNGQTQRSDEKIRDSLRNAALAVIPSVALFAGFCASIMLTSDEDIKVWDYVGTCLFIVSVSFIFSGGAFVIQRVVVRVILWIGLLVPVKYNSFLEFACEAMLLRKMNGAYQFWHPTFQEYFSTVPGVPTPKRSRNGRQLFAIAICISILGAAIAAVHSLYKREARLEDLHEALQAGNEWVEFGYGDKANLAKALQSTNVPSRSSLRIPPRTLGSQIA